MLWQSDECRQRGQETTGALGECLSWEQQGGRERMRSGSGSCGPVLGWPWAGRVKVTPFQSWGIAGRAALGSCLSLTSPEGTCQLSWASASCSTTPWGLLVCTGLTLSLHLSLFFWLSPSPPASSLSPVFNLPSIFRSHQDLPLAGAFPGFVSLWCASLPFPSLTTHPAGNL